MYSKSLCAVMHVIHKWRTKQVVPFISFFPLLLIKETKHLDSGGKVLLGIFVKLEC